LLKNILTNGLEWQQRLPGMAAVVTSCKTPTLLLTNEKF